jgi:hypothetical protein
MVGKEESKVDLVLLFQIDKPHVVKPLEVLAVNLASGNAADECASAGIDCEYSDAEAASVNDVAASGASCELAPLRELRLKGMDVAHEGEAPAVAIVIAWHNKGTHTGLVGGFRPPRPPRDGLEDDA